MQDLIRRGGGLHSCFIFVHRILKHLFKQLLNLLISEISKRAKDTFSLEHGQMKCLLHSFEVAEKITLHFVSLH